MMIVPEAQVTDGMTALNADIGPLLWVVRTHGDPHQLIPAITEQLRQASGGFPVAHIRTMDEVVVRSTARESFNMLLLTIFGAVALVLAAIGIYGLMAYSVQQRTQEMGIRMALGADRAAIRKLVVWQGMRLAVAGVILGIGAAFGLTRLIASFLFGVKAWDPAVFVAVPVILAAVALLAVWLPATPRLQTRPHAGAASGVIRRPANLHFSRHQCALRLRDAARPGCKTRSLAPWPTPHPGASKSPNTASSSQLSAAAACSPIPDCSKVSRPEAARITN